MPEHATPQTPAGSAAIDATEFRQLVDEVERLQALIESLTNRTNTLVHLLDILNKRVDRLESRGGE